VSAKTGRIVRTLCGHTDAVTAVAARPMNQVQVSPGFRSCTARTYCVTFAGFADPYELARRHGTAVGFR
jgi:hypothetical protein